MKRNDALWKAILEDTFEDFLRFLIPDADKVFDFSKSVEYLDKELEQLFPPEGDTYKLRYVDKLAKVYTREGTEEWVLVQVEVQGYHDSLFAKRMFQYYTRIWDKYDRSIVTFAIFTDADKNFHPTRFEQSFLGTSLNYSFNTFKILDQSEAILAESDNPFAIVALTVKAAIQGQQMKDPELYALKIGIAKRLIFNNIERDKIRNIMNFLRYYIRFENEAMDDNFVREVAVLTGNNQANMGIEQFLLEQAKNEGKGDLIKSLLNNNPSLDIKRYIIKTLLAENFTVEQIAEITEVPMSFILELKKSQA